MMIDPQDVVRAREGDRTAFGLLYQAIAKDLYKMALYTLGNPQDAEDAVSDTFIEAYKGIHNLRSAESFRPWMMRILMIRCKRKISGYVKEKGNIALDEYIEQGETDCSLSCGAEIQDVLHRLTPEERQIFLMSALEGYTMREIAEILSLPQGTVSSKLFRTVRKLRAMLS